MVMLFIKLLCATLSLISSPVFAGQTSVAPLTWGSPESSESDPKAVRKELNSKQDFPVVPHDGRDLIQPAQQFLRQNRQILDPLRVEDLVLKIASCVKGKKLQDACYVVFQQQVGGVEVSGSQLNLTVKEIQHRAKIVSIRSVLFPEAKKIAKTSTSDQAILQKAKAALVEGKLFMPGDSLKMDRPRIRYVDGGWRLVAEVKTKQLYRAYVDATRGKVWLSNDRVFFEGHASGRGILFDPTDNVDLDLLDLPHLQVRVQTGTGDSEVATSDVSGNFSLPGDLSGYDATPVGLWSTVTNLSPTDSTLLTLSESFSPTEGPISLLFNPEGRDDETTAQVNAYYHVTFIHDWLRARGIGEEIDRSIPTNVNVSDTEPCNSFYDPRSVTVNFNQAGSYMLPIIGGSGGDETFTCTNAALDSTIIYHEYGHFVDDQIGGMTNRGMSEGWGDIVETYATGQPLIGIGARSSAPFLRSADNDYCFNDLDEIHRQGQVWAGFAWDLRQNLIASLGETEGIPLAEELVLPVFYANPDYPNAGVLEVLIRDDDDGDLSNGTPHQEAILTAAGRHCLGTDLVPPAAVTDLSVTGTTSSSVTLAWTATGDDGIDGIASAYDLRYADFLFTERDFESARQAQGIGSPLPPGSTESQTAECLHAGTTYWFALKVRDEAFNSSSLSNLASGTTLPDTDPPVITPGSIIVTDLGETNASISWEQSDLPCNSVMGTFEYGPTTRYTARGRPGLHYGGGGGTLLGEGVSLHNLLPGTTYHFRIHAWDVSGNEAISEDHTFTTLGVPPPPVCGNGVVETGEECDDGNWNNRDDGCLSRCELCAGPGLRADVYGGAKHQCCEGLAVQGGVCNPIRIPVSSPPNPTPRFGR